MVESFNSKLASRIVGVSLRQIQYWDEQGFVRPSVRLADGRGTRRLYSFSDLVRLGVAKDLTDRGLGLRRVRRCLKPLKQSLPVNGAARGSLHYLTDGDRLFLLTRDRQEILGAMRSRFVLSLGIGRLVEELDGRVRRVTGASGRKRSKTRGI